MKEEATLDPGQPRIEFLYDPDCPSHDEALQRLEEVIAELGEPIPIAVTAVTSHEQAQVQRFLGSPTIRINGSDIEAGAERRGRFALTCRAYVKRDGRISPLPPREMISDAFRRARINSNWRDDRRPNQEVAMPALALGSVMPAFALDEPVTGAAIASGDFASLPAMVVVFTSNHCPHAQAWEGRLLQTAREYQSRAAMVLIGSNDPVQFPEDGPEAMAERARERDYPVPYVFDADQSVAAAFGAARTPDVFVFDHERRLIYHGTVDDNEEEPEQVQVSYLRDALEATLNRRPVAVAETPVRGCGIKWRAGRSPVEAAG